MNKFKLYLTNFMYKILEKYNVCQIYQLLLI